MMTKSAHETMEDIISQRRLRFRFMRHDAWENALFVHWPVDPARLAALLPQGLEPDVHEGSAWIGLVLLTERGVSAHHWFGRKLVRPIDHLGANIRTYVRRGDMTGIFFWSLECSSFLASFGARTAGIPYFPSSMQRSVDVEPFGTRAVRGQSEPADNQQSGDGFVFSFSSVRKGFGVNRPSVSASWRISTDPVQEDQLFEERARWFVERYSVFAAWPWGTGPVLLRGDVQHPSWPVQRAVVESLDAQSLLAAAGVADAIADGPGMGKPHVCFSRGVGPVHFWMLEPA